MRILYVEDDPRDADLARRELSLHAPRISVEVTLTLSAARERLMAAHDFDAVLADLRLPDGLGLDLLAEIRQRGLPLAVVILTGQGDEATAVAALKAGADDYVPKREGYLARLPFVLEAALGRFRAEASRRADAMHVLYAEHHAADIEFTRRHLETHAPHVRLDIVHSSGEVLARLPRTAGGPCPWDVLLLDYSLPGLNALDLLKVLHDERRLEIPVVLVTGLGDEEVAAQALRLGATDYLVKHSNYLFGLPAALENAYHRARLAREQSALRKKTEELEAYSVILSTQQETSLDGILVVDEDGTILSLNQRFLELWGIPPEVAGTGSDQRALEAVVANVVDAEGFLRRVQHLYDHREEKSEEEIALKDGRTFDRYSAPMFAADGKYFGRVWYFRDITQRKQSELVLHEAQERLERAVRAGGVGLWDWDLRTNAVYRSPEWARQIGHGEDEISSGYDEWRSRVHPDDLERAERDRRVCLAPPWPDYLSEFRFRHKDGSFRHILARGSILFDAAGTPVRMLGSHVDITGRAQLEAQLQQAQKMESVGRLAGGVAHDFNNLLTVINTDAEIALSELTGDTGRQELEEILKAGQQAADLTRQLLAFSRKQVLQPVTLDLNALLGATDRMLRRLIGEDVELGLVLAPDLATVRADPGQLEQVVMNLAVNARDAMPSGGMLTIQTQNTELDEAYARAHPGAQPGPFVMLAVSDTGVGMDAATRDRIFEPFFTTKDPGRGTGLGLSTVYGIVQQSGGSIGVYSEPGRGTTFKIYLPRIPETAGAVRPAQAPEPARGTETILIVEDNAALRAVAGRILQSAGFTVLGAADGAEALRLLDGHGGPLHLVLTDVVIPGMSGRELAGRVGTLRPDVKVLYMSGYTDDAIIRHRVLEAGVHFIAKPFTAASLTRKIRDVLDTPEGADGNE